MKRNFSLTGLLAGCSLLFSVNALATVPTVTTNPGNDTVCTGSHAGFKVAAVDTPAPITINYQWQVSTDGSTWSTIHDTAFYAGTGSDSLTVTASMMLNGYLYRCIASNTDGADTSDGGLLVVDTLNAGVITGTSITGGNGALCVGASDNLSDAIPGGVWSHFNHLVDTLSPANVITGLAHGYDTIKYVVTNTCGVAIAQVTMRIDTNVIALPIVGPGTTCVGHTITLTNANVLGTGAWTLSNGSASITSAGLLTGVAHGLDTVTYTFTNACNSVSSTHLVQVDTLLAHGTISGPSAVCAGSWIPLSETVGGGMWISGASDIAVIDGSGNVTGVSQGTATISYYLSNGCGASVATYDVTVYTNAGPIMGTDSVGIGRIRTLADTTAGGIWTVADTSIATIDSFSGALHGVDTGMTTVTYTVSNICGTSSVTMTIYVGPAPYLPAISGLGSVCEGHSITLADSVTGGVWSSSNDTFATVNPTTGVVTGVTTGTINISYTYHNAFDTTTVVKTIFVNHTPVISLTGPGVISLGGNYFIRATPPGGTFSVTNAGAGTIVATFDSTIGTTHYVSYASYVVLAHGTNHIHYVFTNECGTADSVITLTLAGSGVNNINGALGNLTVYPNPSQGLFNVNLAAARQENVTITITNIVGEKVQEVTIATNKLSEVKLDQPAGVYFMTATTSEGRYTEKITIAK